MANKYLISEQKALSDEIRALTIAIGSAIEGHTKASIVITMLSFAILIQEPNLEPDRLQAIISDLTKRIALLIVEEDPDAKVN